MNSIIQESKECWLCHTTLNLQYHHIFRNPHRNASERYGLTVWLCAEHHTGDNGVHGYNKTLDRELKKTAQRKFEETHTREEFIRNFGRSYL